MRMLAFVSLPVCHFTIHSEKEARKSTKNVKEGQKNHTQLLMSESSRLFLRVSSLIQPPNRGEKAKSEKKIPAWASSRSRLALAQGRPYNEGTVGITPFSGLLGVLGLGIFRVIRAVKVILLTRTCRKPQEVSWSETLAEPSATSMPPHRVCLGSRSWRKGWKGTSPCSWAFNSCLHHAEARHGFSWTLQPSTSCFSQKSTLGYPEK